MEVGKYTYGTENIRIHFKNQSKLTIGNFCSIARNLNIYLGGNHMTTWVSTWPFSHLNRDVFNNIEPGFNMPGKNVTIGNDVWIADNVTIMPGVIVGDGAVIATNSHVVKNVEPYSIVGGNPARHIKYRFTKEQIEKLLEIKWWDWEDSKINQFIPLICNTDIDNFINSVNDAHHNLTK